MQLVSLQACCVAITLAAATLCYLNTLPAGFAFDDNFAVVSVPKHVGQMYCHASIASLSQHGRPPSLPPSRSTTATSPMTATLSEGSLCTTFGALPHYCPPTRQALSSPVP